MFGLANPQTLETIGHVAVCYQTWGQPEEVAKSFNLELSRRITMLGLDDIGIFNTLVGIGSCMADMGRIDDAKHYIRQVRKGKKRY